MSEGHPGRVPPVDVQAALNSAVLYALREGCFFPVPQPATDAPVDAWVKWGAMRYFHDAIRAFDLAGGFHERI